MAATTAATTRRARKTYLFLANQDWEDSSPALNTTSGCGGCDSSSSLSGAAPEAAELKAGSGAAGDGTGGARAVLATFLESSTCTENAFCDAAGVGSALGRRIGAATAAVPTAD